MCKSTCLQLLCRCTQGSRGFYVVIIAPSTFIQEAWVCCRLTSCSVLFSLSTSVVLPGETLSSFWLAMAAICKGKTLKWTYQPTVYLSMRVCMFQNWHLAGAGRIKPVHFKQLYKVQSLLGNVGVTRCGCIIGEANEAVASPLLFFRVSHYVLALFCYKDYEPL